MTRLKSGNVSLTESGNKLLPGGKGRITSLGGRNTVENHIPKKLRSRSPDELLNLSGRDFDLDVIGHSLAYQCRFGGHTPIFYSVADHSRLVASLLPPELKLWGLFHDAAESFITDIPTPLKECLSVLGCLPLSAVEQGILHKISKWAKLSWPIPPSVKEADKEAFQLEVIHFWGGQLSGRITEHITISPCGGELRWIQEVKYLKGKKVWG